MVISKRRKKIYNKMRKNQKYKKSRKKMLKNIRIKKLKEKDLFKEAVKHDTSDMDS